MIILPMAGRSSRFVEAGFKQPKYMLPLGSAHGGSSVFRACLSSFEAYFEQETFVFVYLDKKGVRKFLEAELKAVGVPKRNCKFVALSKMTMGQAETVAKGLNSVQADANDHLVIFNIDTIRPGFKLHACVGDKNVAGYLEVIRAEGDHWSFVKGGADGSVVKVAEKQRISDLCSTGLYYFRSVGEFLKAYEATNKANVKSLQGGERYVAPLYNTLIDQGQEVRYDLIPKSQVQFAGTPDEYDALLKVTSGPALPPPAAQSAFSDTRRKTCLVHGRTRVGVDVGQAGHGPWGHNSDLTVLLHGMYDEGNRVYMTDLARSWRRTLPGVQVGFAASEIEKNISQAERDFWQQRDLDWIDDRRTRLVRQLRPEMDFLLEGEPASVLAPLKFDDKVNNCNKMIASVQAGLAAVQTRWVLRIRSDALIRHPQRMSEVYDCFAKHVGSPKAFRQPVAVSPYYTINPYGLERMSFHISDWYNLGLTEDVRNYWDVAPMTMADATYYEGIPHAHHTNAFEKSMRAKMPPEMMIATAFAKRNGYVVPDYFNELGYESEGLTFIRENFVMPDPDAIGMSIGKYANERKWFLTKLLVISHAEWRILAEGGEEAFRRAIAPKQRLLHWAEARRNLNVLSHLRRSDAIKAIGWLLKS